MGKKQKQKAPKKEPPVNKGGSASSDGSLKSRAMRMLFACFFIIVFIAGVMIRVSNLSNVTSRSPDEMTYTAQAQKIMELGSNGFKLLIHEHAMDKSIWVFPPPIRVGFTWLLVFVMKVTHDTGPMAGSYLSCFFSILSLVLIIVAGLRLFNPVVALSALLFLAFSPMDIAVARRSWQDALFGFIGLGIIYFTSEIIKAKDGRKFFLPLVFLGSYSVLVKESGWVMYGLCGAWIFISLVLKDKRYKEFLQLTGLVAVGIGISLSVLFYNTGGVAPVLQVLAHLKEGLPTNEYAKVYQSGPWYEYIASFGVISPVAFLFCIISLVITALFSERDYPEIYTGIRSGRSLITGLITIMLVFIWSTIIVAYLQNLRYVSPIYGIFYLLGGMGVWSCLSILKVRTGKAVYITGVSLAVVFLLFSAARDIGTFDRMFLRTGIKDVSVKLVMRHVK